MMPSLSPSSDLCRSSPQGYDKTPPETPTQLSMTTRDQPHNSPQRMQMGSGLYYSMVGEKDPRIDDVVFPAVSTHYK